MRYNVLSYLWFSDDDQLSFLKIESFPFRVLVVFKETNQFLSYFFLYFLIDVLNLFEIWKSYFDVFIGTYFQEIRLHILHCIHYTGYCIIIGPRRIICFFVWGGQLILEESFGMKYLDIWYPLSLFAFSSQQLHSCDMPFIRQ